MGKDLGEVVSEMFDPEIAREKGLLIDITEDFQELMGINTEEGITQRIFFVGQCIATLMEHSTGYIQLGDVSFMAKDSKRNKLSGISKGPDTDLGLQFAVIAKREYSVSTEVIGPGNTSFTRD